MMRRAILLFLVVIAAVSASPSLQTLETRLYAVHATRQLPEAGVVKADLAWPAETPKEIRELMPRIRFTLHFALGELVRPVADWKSWENCPYAVVTPLGSLKSGLLNINCYDTFILGDLTFTRDTVLVLPYGERAPRLRQGKLHWYDPHQQTLREAVDECIADEGGWMVTMNEEGEEDVLQEALYRDANINTPEFFAELLKRHPHVSMGVRFDELDGEHYRLSGIEMALLGLVQKIVGYPKVHEELPPLTAWQLEELEFEYSQWRASLEGSQLGHSALRALVEMDQVIDAWIRLGYKVIVLQEHGIDLSELPRDQLRDIVAAARSDEELEAALELYL